MTSVTVQLPIGEATFSRCTIDEFCLETLEVTACGAPLDGLTMRIFRPGEWLAATVYDERGNPLYWWNAAKTPVCATHEEGR